MDISNNEYIIHHAIAIQKKIEGYDLLFVFNLFFVYNFCFFGFCYVEKNRMYLLASAPLLRHFFLPSLS